MIISRAACTAVVASALVLGTVTPVQAAPAAFLPVTESFESPVLPADFWSPYISGQDLASWKVTSGSADLVTYWKASHGRQSVDLNGVNAGAITRTFKTAPFVRYRLTFDLAGNPDGGANPKTGEVWADGHKIHSFSFNSTGKTRTNMGYVRRDITFYGRDFSTPITIKSTNTGNHGPVVDNVKFRHAVLP